jgi:dihydrolipoamide dehydrogenase
VLVSVGRRPNSDRIGIENTKCKVDDRGFITVDSQRRTSDPKIFAIGDIACEPMLAHKAMREAKVAVDAICGHPAVFDPACIPAVVYTDPEVAWCGVTEPEAVAKGMEIKVTRFPWAASGRAVAMGRTDGLTKMIFDAKTQRLLGVGIVGAHAGDLISEGVVAMEMAAVAEDIGSSIHPHPATSETLAEAADALFGRAIHGSH